MTFHVEQLTVRRRRRNRFRWLEELDVDSHSQAPITVELEVHGEGRRSWLQGCDDYSPQVTVEAVDLDGALRIAEVIMD